MSARKTTRSQTANPGAGAPPSPPAPSPLARPGREFSAPWMGPWVEVATRTASLEAACLEAGVSLGEVLEGRLADRAFDEACRLQALVADLKITEALRANAMKGEPRAQALYFGRVRDLVLSDEPEGFASAFTAEVAEAMVRAGLEALAGEGAGPAPPRPAAAPPLRPPARARRRPPRPSRDEPLDVEG